MLGGVESRFDADIQVHYGYALLGATDADPDLPLTRRGQINGLLGAAVPSVLSFVTGLHTGTVPLQIVWHDLAPTEPGPEYLDVVEAAFQPRQAELLLWTFDYSYPVTLPAVASLRARYSIAGMDEGNEMDTCFDEPPVEHELLDLWPSSVIGDAILRSDSRTGAYWHAAVAEEYRRNASAPE